MTVSKKIVFLIALANDQQGRLKLFEEERIIRNHLSTSHDSGSIEYCLIPDATVDDIFFAFDRFHNRIGLFHFAGHSGSDFLQLGDGLARSSCLSVLMGMQKNLKAVFLNGCANAAQVAALSENGVKAIIATSESIQDKRSIHLSDAFYHAFANGKSIKDAFDTARARLNNDFPDLEITCRNLGTRQNGQEKNFPWALYSGDQNDLDWVIPKPAPEMLFHCGMVQLNNPEVNQNLVKLTLKGFGASAAVQEDKQFWTTFKKDPDQLGFHLLQGKLLEVMPDILGDYIQELFTYEGRTNGRLRLKILNSAYLAMIRLLCTIALANLWKEKTAWENLHPQKKFTIRPSYRKDIQKFMHLDLSSAKTFDYGRLIYTVSCILKENNCAFYVEEMQSFVDSLAAADQYYDAYRFLENDIRNPLIDPGKIPDEAVEFLCEQGEYQLGMLLEKCAFLAYYQLVTVREILVFNPHRTDGPRFIHHKTVIKGTNPDTMDAAPLSLKEFKNHKTVMISKSIAEDIPTLNLSPFLVDENAFKTSGKDGRPPKLHFLDVYNEENGHFYQHAVNLGVPEGFILQKGFDAKKYVDFEILIKQIEQFKEEFDLKPKT